MKQPLRHEVSHGRARIFRASALLLGATVLATACGQEKNTGCVSDTPAARSNPLAQKVTRVIQEHGTTHFDANVKVVCGDKQTVAPVTAQDHGKTHYFKLQGIERDVHAVELMNVDAHDIQPVHYAENDDIRAVNSSGIIDTETRTHIPSIELHLSDGSSPFRSIGQTSAVEK
jgi:hypothetical protein